MMNRTNETISGENASDDAIVCYLPAMITTFSVWRGDNPLNYTLPLFVVQLILVIAATRLFVFLLKPFRQPRVVAEILGGLLLGPSFLEQNETFGKAIFPLSSVLIVETMANVGLTYLLFLVGLEMDISAIERTGKKALFIAISGMVLPFIVGACFFFFHNHNPIMNHGTNILFLGVALSATAFPVLALILADFKLLNTDLGRLAQSTALINDVCAWILLVLAIALAGSNKASNPWACLWVILSSMAYVVMCFYVVRPAMSWFLSGTLDVESFTDSQICVIVTGVMVSSFITDAMGTHAILGAYLYGLAIPSGTIGVTIIEKLEDFVSGLLLPLYFAISGLKTNITAIHGITKWAGCLLVIPLACAGKVLGTVLVSLFFHIPARDGVILGLLMNTKGVIEITVLNIAKELKVMGDESFAMVVIATVVMTGLIAPFVTVTYKPTRRFIPIKKRTILGLRHDAERKFMVCVHNPRNVPSMLNLLEASHPTKKSPLSIHALHLVELTGRISAMLAVWATSESGHRHVGVSGTPESDHIVNSFENFEENIDNVSINYLTAASPYSTMHQDICSLAEDKGACVILIPFHKQQAVDGEMEETNPALRMVNQKLLEHSPCSIGILVDRGFNSSSRLSSNHLACAFLHVAVLFFGGPHDREALAYALWMSKQPGTFLTVTHFIAGPATIIKPPSDDEDELNIHSGKEKEKNEEYMSYFRKKTGNMESVVYVEKVVNNGEETVSALGAMKNGFNLLIVGRDQGVSPLTDGLIDWSEYPELGAIGDLLASSDFGTTASVLVMQQYVIEEGESNASD
ncbi:cation/H(+) antiporter 15-like [Neltuma alba]|uniref:cation/H(+) antiporter 15-like n=1 Tax=Neltuma alba TaxID=207710 RepID=UPI0010A4BEE4|nr:cation/H(+) antiporter 15-like [Prosopis alba]